jgi:transcriptional regulatory protein RtcR
MKKKTIVIGLIGNVMDRGTKENRWESWRPSVALFQNEDLLIDRFELLSQKKFLPLVQPVIDDIAAVSPETSVCLHEIEFVDPWDFEAVYATLHDFAANYPFKTDQEDYLVHITTGTHVAQICFFLLCESRIIPGKLIQASPPKRANGNEPGGYAIIDLDLSKYDRIAQRFAARSTRDISLLKSGIATRNTAFNELIAELEQVASLSLEPLLLLGTTGVGKSHLARKIYEVKKLHRRLAGPFVEVNCATLRGDGAMSALFGHKKGAFTGALQDRPGLLKCADTGLLFLDEVGELGRDEQAMLLRAIEEKRFLPVGSDRETESHFQLICGTNRNLVAEVQKGNFREDLLARINLWTFRLPDLKDRSEDIEPNIHYELDRFLERTGNRVVFRKEALTLFLAFATNRAALWKGNFRDLSGAIIRMATLAIGGCITTKEVQKEIARLQHAWSGEVATPDPTSAIARLIPPAQQENFDLFDRLQLDAVIKLCQQHKNLSAAGRALFEVSRQQKSTINDADRLRKYLERFGISWHDIKFGSEAGNKSGSGMNQS